MIKGYVYLDEAQIKIERERIERALRAAHLVADDISYTPLSTDHLGETQGGWFVNFDKKTREKLKAASLSWGYTGACSGDFVDDCIAAIVRTGNECKKSGKTSPEPQPRKVVVQVEQGAGKTKSAIRRYDYPKNDRNSKLLDSAVKKLKGLGHLTNEEIIVAIDYYIRLEAFARLDPALAATIPYIVQNLTQLQQWQSARSR